MMRLPLTKLLLLLLLFSSCNIIYQDNSDSHLDDHNTYLLIQIGNLTNATTRAQKDSPSINEDTQEHEDYIRNLIILIFDSNGNKMGDEKIDGINISRYTVMKVKPGLAKLYFIANFPDGDENRIRNMSRTQLDAYIRELRPFDSYQGASDESKYFPMARVYSDQLLPEGGTKLLPKAFHPNVGTTRQLAPVSNYGEDHEGRTTQEKVNLVRSCAKISIELKGRTLKDVTEVVYNNAVQNYSFAELDKNSYSALPLADPNDVALTFYGVPTNSPAVNFPISDKWAGGVVSQLYVPERLFADSEQPKWIKSATEDRFEGGVQYITITLSNGLVYNIPVVFNADKAKPGQSYVDFARNGNGTELPNFDVVRNMHYKFIINISKRVLVEFDIEPMKTEELEDIHIYPTQ